MGFSGRAQAGAIELEEEFASNLPEVLVDPHRVTQVVANLIDNALKFTPPGGKVRIEAALRRRSAAGCSSPSPTPARASRRSTSTTSSSASTRSATAASRAAWASDSGLFICREIVRLHGGELSVASEVGQGTTFRFTLPIAPATESKDNEGSH
jgi:signal transduction histidine kinase